MITITDERFERLHHDLRRVFKLLEEMNKRLTRLEHLELDTHVEQQRAEKRLRQVLEWMDKDMYPTNAGIIDKYTKINVLKVFLEHNPDAKSWVREVLNEN